LRKNSLPCAKRRGGQQSEKGQKTITEKHGRNPKKVKKERGGGAGIGETHPYGQRGPFTEWLGPKTIRKKKKKRCHQEDLGTRFGWGQRGKRGKTGERPQKREMSSGIGPKKERNRMTGPAKKRNSRKPEEESNTKTGGKGGGGKKEKEVAATNLGKGRSMGAGHQEERVSGWKEKGMKKTPACGAFHTDRDHKGKNKKP